MSEKNPVLHDSQKPAAAKDEKIKPPVLHDSMKSAPDVKVVSPDKVKEPARTPKPNP